MPTQGSAGSNGTQATTAIAPVGLIGAAKGARMTRNQKAALEYRILEVLREHHPQSVRQVFYRCLESSTAIVAWVRKSLSGYQRVQHAVRDMRRDRRIPWDWIVDETRVTRNYDYGYESYRDFVDSVEERFALEFWAPTIGSHVEIWTESRGVEASIARPVAQEWRAATVAFGGQPSDGLLYECAKRILSRDHPTLILYAGDLDAHGMHIEEKPRQKLKEIWGCDPDWLRVLVNPDQVTAYNLPSDENDAAIQAEAFPIDEARGLVEQAILTLATREQLDAHRECENNLYWELQCGAQILDDEMGGDPFGLAKGRDSFLC